ncbi:hypothetical protein ACI2KD_01765 [Pseudomonas monteilii]|jgi:phosphopantetheine adenylyltransferase
MQDTPLDRKEVIKRLSASLNLDEAKASILKSEIENVWATLDTYKVKHDSMHVELKLLEQELESTRATSVERKNNLKVAQEKATNNDLIIEGLRKTLNTRDLEKAGLVRKLSKLEGQLEILSQLVTRV